MRLAANGLYALGEADISRITDLKRIVFDKACSCVVAKPTELRGCAIVISQSGQHPSFLTLKGILHHERSP
jgi:hypothetical protein